MNGNKLNLAVGEEMPIFKWAVSHNLTTESEVDLEVS